MTLDVLWSSEALRLSFGDVALEVGVGTHLGEGRAGLGVSEEVLGEEDDQRLSVVTVNLSTQGVANRASTSVQDEREERTDGTDKMLEGTVG